MTMTTTELLETWREEELAAALEWHKANMGKRLTPEMKKAFTAGFNQGWAKLRAIEALHKIIN